MAIAFDTSTKGNASATSVTVSHTVTGSNPTLFVSVRDLDNTLTGITYNSVAMTQIETTLSVGGNNISLWRLFGPATGAHDVVATKSSGTSRIDIYNASYTGTNQSALDNSGTGTTGSGTSHTQSLTTVADNCWIIWGMGNNQDTMTAGANTTIRQQATNVGIADTNGAQTPAGSKSMNFTTGITFDTAGGIMASISEFVASSGAGAFLFNML